MAAVVLENVDVEFPIYGAHSLRAAVMQRAAGGLVQRDKRHHHRVIVKALSDVSLELRDGDRLGLVGHNGAGKSTLLKLIGGVYEPVRGRVLIDGNITALFDPTVGLHGDDTGYESIVTSGLLLGLTRSEIEKKIPEIEQFSELGEYLSLPIRTYSAGMVTRLGFAVATAIDPGILLMDESIATGDARFTERARARMHEFIHRSHIVVLASHSNDIIKSICNKAALMHGGKLLKIASVDEVLADYDALVHATPTAADSGKTAEATA